MDQPEPTKPMDKLSDKTAAEVSARARLTDQARGVLTDGMTTRQFLDRLIERQRIADAVGFLAHALPKREAVWWATICVTQVLGQEPPPKAAAAIESARTWVTNPKDENRRATFPAAEAADLATPAGCTAVAAYFSGGSLAPASLPQVPPAEHLTALMVSSALSLAAVFEEPEKSQEKLAIFLRIGLEVASGQQTWPEAPPDKIESTEKERLSAYGYARRARR